MDWFSDSRGEWLCCRSDLADGSVLNHREMVRRIDAVVTIKAKMVRVVNRTRHSRRGALVEGNVRNMSGSKRDVEGDKAK